MINHTFLLWGNKKIIWWNMDKSRKRDRYDIFEESENSNYWVWMIYSNKTIIIFNLTIKWEHEITFIIIFSSLKLNIRNLQFIVPTSSSSNRKKNFETSWKKDRLSKFRWISKQLCNGADFGYLEFGGTGEVDKEQWNLIRVVHIERQLIYTFCQSYTCIQILLLTNLVIREKKLRFYRLSFCSYLH